MWGHKMRIVRIFTILIICFSILNFQLGNLGSIRFGMTPVYASEDEGGSMNAPSKSSAYLGLLTMIAIGYYGSSLYKNCKPQSKDTIVAAVAAGVFIVNEINSYRAYKEWEEQTELSYDETDHTDSQHKAIETLKKNYENVQKILKMKLTFQTVAAAAFAGAAVIAFKMATKSEAEVAKCEAGITETTTAASRCIKIYATENPPMAAKCQNVVTSLGKVQASIKSYKSNMFFTKNKPSMISGKEGRLMLKVIEGDQTAFNTVFSTIISPSVRTSGEKMSTVCKKWMFSEEGVIQQCHPTLDKLKVPQATSGSMESIFDLFIPSANAGLMNASSLIGIGVAGTVLLVAYGYKTESKFDKKMVHPKHRGWVWTGFGAAVAANIYFTTRLLSAVDKNVSTLNDILQKWDEQAGTSESASASDSASDSVSVSELVSAFNPFMMDAFATKIDERMGYAPCILAGKTKGRCSSAVAVFKKHGIRKELGPKMRKSMDLLATITDGLQGKKGYSQETLRRAKQFNKYAVQMKKMNRITSRKSAIRFEAYQKKFVDNITSEAKKGMQKSGISMKRLMASMNITDGLSNKMRKQQKKITTFVPAMNVALTSTEKVKNNSKQTGTAIDSNDPVFTDRRSHFILDATIHKDKEASIFKLISRRYLKRMGPMIR